MAKKLTLITFILSLFSGIMFSEEIQEIVILEKKLSSLNGWSNNQSITSISEKELDDLDAQHPKQIFRRSPGIWISRGSGQEHLTAIRSPVLTGPGACGSFLVLEDGLPVRPTGFCNVNGLFETFFEMASGLETITGPASARYGANAMHGVVNILSKPITSENKFYTNVGPNNYKNFKIRTSNQENWSFDGHFANNDGFRDKSGYDQQKIKIQSIFSLSSWDAALKATLTNLNQETAGYINGLDSYKNEEFSRRNFNPDAYRDANSQRVSLRLTKEDKNTVNSITSYIRSNDMKFFHPNGFVRPAEMYEYVCDAVEQLLIEARAGKSSTLSIGFHLRIGGRPARFRAVTKILEYLADLDAQIWRARRIDIARHFAAVSQTAKT